MRVSQKIFARLASLITHTPPACIATAPPAPNAQRRTAKQSRNAASQVGSGHFHTKVKGKDHLKEGSAHSDLELKVARVRRPPDWSTEVQKNTYRIRALCILKNTGDHEDYLGGRIAGPYGLPVDQQRICDHAVRQDSTFSLA